MIKMQKPILFLYTLLIAIFLFSSSVFALTSVTNIHVEADGVNLYGYCTATAPTNYNVIFGWKWFDNGTMVLNNSFDVSTKDTPGVDKLILTLPGLQLNHSYQFECTPYSYDSSLIDVALNDTFDSGNYTAGGWYPAESKIYGNASVSIWNNATFFSERFEESGSSLKIKKDFDSGNLYTGYAKNLGAYLSSIYTARMSVEIWNNSGAYYFYFNANDTGVSPDNVVNITSVKNGMYDYSFYITSFSNALMKVVIKPGSSHKSYKLMGCKGCVGHCLCDYNWTQEVNYAVTGYYNDSSDTLHRLPRTILSGNVFVPTNNDSSSTTVPFEFSYSQSDGTVNMRFFNVLTILKDNTSHYTGYQFDPSRSYFVNVKNTSVWPASYQPFNSCFSTNCSAFKWFAWYGYNPIQNDSLRILNDAFIELSTITISNVNETGSAMNSTSLNTSSQNDISTPDPITSNPMSAIPLTINSRGCLAVGDLDGIKGLDMFETDANGTRILAYNSVSQGLALEQRLTTFFDRSYYYCRAFIYDYNHDGFNDIIVAGVSTNDTPHPTIDIWLNTRNQNFTLWSSLNSTQAPMFDVNGNDTSTFNYGDIDLNGYPEIIARATNTSLIQSVLYYRGTSSGYVYQPSAVAALPVLDSDFGLGKFSGGSFLDLAYGSKFYKFQSGQFVDSGVTFANYQTNQIEVDDFNQDGFPDMMVSHSDTDGSWTDVYISTSPFNVVKVDRLPYGIRFGGHDSCDVRNDGNIAGVFVGYDVIADPANQYRAFAGEYDLNTSSLIGYGFPEITDIGRYAGEVFLKDIDGDGDCDFIVMSHSNGQGNSSLNPVIYENTNHDPSEGQPYQRLDFSDTDIVDMNDQSKGLLPEFYAGIKEFVGAAGVPWMRLMFVFILILFVLALIGLFVALIMKVAHIGSR
jgi:hypothetical protein